METDPLRVGDTFDSALATVAGRRPGRRTRKPLGRPTRLHQGLIDQVADLVRKGYYQETAAVAVGISSSTYHLWKARGQEARTAADSGVPIPAKEAIYVQFLETVEKARAEALGEVVEVHRNVALGGVVTEIEEWTDDDGHVHTKAVFERPNPKAMEWWMERSFPHLYGRRIEVGGPEGGPIPIEVEVSARDLLKKRLGQVAERLDAKAPIDVTSTPVDPSPQPKENP